MKAKATERFVDREAGIVREDGEVFEVSPERLSVLAGAGYAVAVDEPKQPKRTSKTK